jgi:hypothetical protein
MEGVKSLSKTAQHPPETKKTTAQVAGAAGKERPINTPPPNKNPAYFFQQRFIFLHQMYT